MPITSAMDAPPYLVGQFLLAMPGIGDPRFEKAVIAMCVHDEDGALGIGLGRIASKVRFHDLLKQLDIDPGSSPNQPVHLGGPVEPQRGFVIHTSDWGGDGSVDVAGRWTLSATLEVLRAIAEGRGPTRWVVALGYAGWGPGQLEQEMRRHGWFTTEAGEALLFDADVGSRWQDGFTGAGVDPRLLTAESGTA